jgi:hypothetical protein
MNSNLYYYFNYPFNGQRKSSDLTTSSRKNLNGGGGLVNSMTAKLITAKKQPVTTTQASSANVSVATSLSQFHMGCSTRNLSTTSTRNIENIAPSTQPNNYNAQNTVAATSTGSPAARNTSIQSNASTISQKGISGSEKSIVYLMKSYASLSKRGEKVNAHNHNHPQQNQQHHYSHSHYQTTHPTSHPTYNHHYNPHHNYSLHLQKQHHYGQPYASTGPQHSHHGFQHHQNNFRSVNNINNSTHSLRMPVHPFGSLSNNNNNTYNRSLNHASNLNLNLNHLQQKSL